MKRSFWVWCADGLSEHASRCTRPDSNGCSFCFVLALLCLYNFIILSLFDHLDHCASARYVFMLKERGGDAKQTEEEERMVWRATNEAPLLQRETPEAVILMFIQTCLIPPPAS